MRMVKKMLPSVGTKNLFNREKWLKEAVLSIPAGNKILDAGAGELKYKNFCSHLEYVSQDFGQYDGVGDKSGLQVGSWDQTKLDIVCDIINIPVPDNSFDAIMCIEVFEHLPNPIAALKEFSRILKPGGTLIITAPFCSLTHFAPYHFYTGFTKYFYEHHLQENFFKIADMNFNGGYFEYLGQEVRRVKSISEQYTNVKMDYKTKLAIFFLLKFLNKSDVNDKGSNQLLTHGLHIKAYKQ